MDAVYSILGYVVCHLCQCGACDGAHSIHRFSKIRNFRTPTNLYRFKAHMMEFHQSPLFVWVCMCMNCLHVCICRCMFIIIDDLVHRICSICLHLNFPVSIEHTLRRLSIIWVYLFIFRWKFKPRTIFVYGLSRWCDSFIQNHRNNYEHTCKIINTKKCITAAIPIQKCAIQNPLWYYTLCVYLKNGLHITRIAWTIQKRIQQHRCIQRIFIEFESFNLMWLIFWQIIVLRCIKSGTFCWLFSYQ